MIERIKEIIVLTENEKFEAKQVEADNAMIERLRKIFKENFITFPGSFQKGVFGKGKSCNKYQFKGNQEELVARLNEYYNSISYSRKKSAKEEEKPIPFEETAPKEEMCWSWMELFERKVVNEEIKEKVLSSPASSVLALTAGMCYEKNKVWSDRVWNELEKIGIEKGSVNLKIILRESGLFNYSVNTGEISLKDYDGMYKEVKKEKRFPMPLEKFIEGQVKSGDKEEVEEVIERCFEMNNNPDLDESELRVTKAYPQIFDEGRLKPIFWNSRIGAPEIRVTKEEIEEEKKVVDMPLKFENMKAENLNLEFKDTKITIGGLSILMTGTLKLEKVEIEKKTGEN